MHGVSVAWFNYHQKRRKSNKTINLHICKFLACHITVDFSTQCLRWIFLMKPQFSLLHTKSCEWHPFENCVLGVGLPSYILKDWRLAKMEAYLRLKHEALELWRSKKSLLWIFEHSGWKLWRLRPSNHVFGACCFSGIPLYVTKKHFMIQWHNIMSPSGHPIGVNKQYGNKKIRLD